MVKEYWLKCKIEPGMFSSERLFCITDINGCEHSGFANEYLVDEKNGLVKVEIGEYGEEKAVIWFNPAWEMYSHSCVVAKSQIVEKEI